MVHPLRHPTTHKSTTTIANGNRPHDPANADNGANVQVCFINDIAAWLIKSIRVKPKRRHDVEVVSPYLAFEESLRSDFQTSKDEKESEQLLFYRGYDPKMNYNPHKDKCGFAKAAPDAEELVVKNFEIYQYNLGWIPIIIKPLPGFFHEKVPGLFKPFNCTKIQLYIDDRPVFQKGHINWTNDLTNRRYMWGTQCDMVADIGDSKRVNIGNFPVDKIQNGRWFAYVDLTPNRKKGVANTVRKFDGIFSARVWFNQTNAGNRRQLVIGWFERGELMCVNPLDNSWAPKTFKQLPTKIPIKFSNIRDSSTT